MSAERPGQAPGQPGCLSDLALDRVVAGAAPDPHLEACARCGDRLELLRAAARVDAPLIEAALAAAKAPPHRRLDLRVAFGGLAAVALAALVFLLPTSAPHAPDPGVRAKGVALAFFVSRDGVVERGRSGEAYAAGDALRFVVSGPAGYLMLAGVETNGDLAVYHPYGGGQSAPFAGATEQPLADSLILDDATETEHFIALFSPSPITVDALRAALPAPPISVQDLTRMPLPAELSVVEIRRSR